MNTRPPLRPFTEETARQKVQLAEDGWNSLDPERVALAYPSSVVASPHLFERVAAPNLCTK